MKLEVKVTDVSPASNPDAGCHDDDNSYWVATVVSTCGPLLRLQFDGYQGDDGCGEFWCDLKTTEVHPVGWCAANNKNLQPPAGKPLSRMKNTMYEFNTM